MTSSLFHQQFEICTLTLMKRSHVFSSKKELKKAIKHHSDNKRSATKKYGRMNKWDVSAITDMSTLFYGYSNFNEDISAWDTSKVTDMSSMFYNCKYFNKDLSK